MNYNTYDVAVMNYPLFAKNIDTIDLQNNIFMSDNKNNFETPIYIHIPFCDSLCNFCIYDRVFARQNSDIVEEYFQSLLKEIRMYNSYDYIKKLKIGSVFLGGGTPTVLNENQFYRLFNTLSECFDIGDCEITVECNIASADKSKLKLLRNLGVTRISTGIQTLNDKLRNNLNIQGDSNDVLKWIYDGFSYGFKEVSADLIYGFYGTDTKDLLDDIRQLIKLNLNHISVYKLAVFAYTRLYKQVDDLGKAIVLDDTIEDMFYCSHDFLLENGYKVRSTQEYGKDNDSVKFWDLTYDGYSDNISFGSSCFGYVNGFCYQNENNVNNYISKARKMLPISRISPQINVEQLPERTMVMGLRKGYVSKNNFIKNYEKQISDLFDTQIKNQIKNNLIYEDDSGYGLTPKGIYNQGTVSSEYMISIFKNVSALKKKMCIGLHEMP